MSVACPWEDNDLRSTCSLCVLPQTIFGMSLGVDQITVIAVCHECAGLCLWQFLEA